MAYLKFVFCQAIYLAIRYSLCLLIPKGIKMNELIQELKVKIIESLNLIDISPKDINENAQLIGGDLGLDSIDVLELVMMLEKDYGVKIDSRELGIKVFASVAALADYVQQYRSEKVKSMA